MILENLGILGLFLSMILQVIIPPIPAELIVIAAGKLYGIFWTTIIAGSGLYIGSVIVYFIGFYIYKAFAKYFDRKNVHLVVEKIKEYENWLLWVRILPYNPSDIISYAAGIVQLSKKKFLIISFVTSFVRCFILAYFGSFITGFKTGLLIVSLLIISAFISYTLVFVYKSRKNKKS